MSETIDLGKEKNFFETPGDGVSEWVELELGLEHPCLEIHLIEQIAAHPGGDLTYTTHLGLICATMRNMSGGSYARW